MSIFKKIKSVKKQGLKPIMEGKENYSLNIPEIEEKAIKRSLVCMKCEDNVKEPIYMFRVQDRRIDRLNERMCDECGCALPYLLRQDIKICKKWSE